MWRFVSAFYGNGHVSANLYDESGKSIAYNDDGAGNGNFLISYELQEGKTYTLKISGWSEGKYVIDIPEQDGWQSQWYSSSNYIGLIVTAPQQNG